ncbi:MAG: MBOAT family protein [Fimbriimonadaceae bacterium]|nr:MBOAT family protein [Fimbriimonadaceae bacterium]
MLFNTGQFALFFLLVYTLYLRLNHRAQNVMLLLVSWYFYACWNWRFLFLLLASTVIDYCIGLAMEHREGHQRRRLVTASIVVNLGILGCFKYFNFFVDSANAVLHGLGFHPHLPVLNVVLPVGISFYTFQAMAYTIDIYRRDAAPCRDFVTFALYVAYFPHLVAGPIQRTHDLLPQLAVPRRVTAAMLRSGALLILIGMVRKVAIADMLAGQVDAVFSDPGGQSSFQLLQGLLMFALQVYGDFAGYTDMARGISRMMGIELIENFRQPYLATDITDFWRRWHISLSRWLRDYLYIPLGGNRGPTWFVYRNLMLTMLLGGLWHGASWNFVIWGGIQGIALAVHRAVAGDRRKTVPSRSRPRQLLCWAGTMAVVGLSWVFFRAHTLEGAISYLGGILHWHGGLLQGFRREPLYALVLLLLVDLPQHRQSRPEAMHSWPTWIRGVVYALLVLAIITLRPNVNAPFIYFQF